jgi:hypothetical protein
MRRLLTVVFTLLAVGLPAAALQAAPAAAAPSQPGSGPAAVLAEEAGGRSDTLAAAQARILVGQGTGSCPQGYACLWEHANFTGRGVGFFNTENDFNVLPTTYRFIQDSASSVFNNGTSGMQIRLCEHRVGGGRCISLARGWTFPDLSHPVLNMNDTISSLQWFWG